MKPVTWRLVLLAGSLLFVLLLVLLVKTAPKNPVALIRVVDAAGKPVAGAVVHPEGLRTKPGPYVSGWYGWRTDHNGVTNSPVTTDKEGRAHVPYPKYVFEHIETGTLCLAVNHPDFVPDRPERVVATAPPAGAPWLVRAKDLWDRIQHKTLIARPDPVVLKKGAILKVAIQPDGAISGDARLFAQVSDVPSEDANFWIRPEPGVILTRRLGAGNHTVRAVQLDADGTAWFSKDFSITAVAGQTNDVKLAFQRGVTVRGQLDDAVPRPVKNGRVVAHVWPQGARPQDSPPQWHAWTTVSEDGSFSIGLLPAGNLEISAMCDGFVSTNGPGQTRMHYPQKHVLGTNDLTITIGMELTARLEVKVTDEQGQPLKGVRVVTWPNVRYGEWSATILMGDCYNTSESLRREPARKFSWRQPVPDFEGVSDGAGVAVLANLPADVTELAVDHPQFDLPAVGTATGGKRREARFTLTAGQTNHVSIQLEPRERSKISHY